MAWKKVVIGKVDQDTIGCAYFMGVTRNDVVEVARSGQASVGDLADPSVLCIEIGGAGEVHLNNFDHHGLSKAVASATLQAYQCLRSARIREADIETYEGAMEVYAGAYAGQARSEERLAEYVDLLDTQGPQALPSASSEQEKPYLSDIMAGMFLTTRDPVEQFHRGIEILREVCRRTMDPFGSMRALGFVQYAEAKAENDRRVKEAVESAQWTTTASGKKLGYLETDFFGAPGALYQAGAQIVVAYAPRFGNPPVPKFTVAGNGVRVDAALPALNVLESGWGGPATGTIIGSPRAGSALSLDQVVEAVINAL